MIYSGEFRLHLVLMARILGYDKNARIAINKTLIDINDSNLNFDSSRSRNYIQSAISSVNKLESDSLSSDQIKLNYIQSIYKLAQDQYDISLDKFLEENFIEIPIRLKEATTYLGFSTSRFGDMACRFIDINMPFSSINNGKYSNEPLTWSKFGGFNSPCSADFN